MKIISQHTVSPCLVCGNTTAELLQSEVSWALRHLQCTKCGWNVGVWIGNIDALLQEWDMSKREYENLRNFCTSKYITEVTKVYEPEKYQRSIKYATDRADKIFNARYAQEITPEIASGFSKLL